MKKIFLMFVIILVLSLCIMVQSSLPKEEVKPLNDIIIYLVTCIFILLLVDYIFKMGKNSNSTGVNLLSL